MTRCPSAVHPSSDPTNRIALGSSSTAPTSSATAGPALCTAIVYSTSSPGCTWTGSTDFSVVIRATGSGASVTSAVARETLSDSSTSASEGAVAIAATLSSAPLVPPGTRPVIATVAEPSRGRPTGTSTSPVPEAAPHEDPAGVVQVQVTSCRTSGTATVRWLGSEAFGPTLRAVTV